MDGPSSYAQPLAEPDSLEVITHIARSLPPVERAYAVIRFAILRSKLLTILNLVLPETGRILDVGCGFGLWSAYLASMEPSRRFVGIDPNGRRVQIARTLVQKLGLEGHTFLEGLADSPELDGYGPFDAAFMLDVLHHVPKSAQVPLLARLDSLLAPGGVLLVKDITTDVPWRTKFTEVLDRVMVGMNEELTYRHHGEWRALLEGMGYSVRVVRVPDVLPYPHVVVVGRKPLSKAH